MFFNTNNINAYNKFGYSQNHEIKLNDFDYFEIPGINVLVFNNWFDGNFSDSKISGIDIIHYVERTVTNGYVRLNPKPEQWDPFPQFIERRINKYENSIKAFLTYPDFNSTYSIKVIPDGVGFLLSVNLIDKLPDNLIGKAGLKIEFILSPASRNL